MRLNTQTCSLLTIGLGVFGILASTAARADDHSKDHRIEEITVTATKTGTKSLQDVPLAISAFSGEQLERSGVKDLAGIATLTPSFNYTHNGPMAIASIRGIGTNNTFVGGDPSTTLQIDGVYIGRPSQASFDLMDVARVEILRGPQGTLYGRNATAGTINVITKDPSNELEGDLRASFGTEGTNLVEGRLNLPLISDTLALAVTGRYAEHDGYVENLAADSDDLWTDEYSAFRAKLRWTPIDDLAVTLSADHIDRDARYNFYSARLPVPGNPLGAGTFDGLEITDIHKAAFNEPNNLANEAWGVGLTAEANLGGLMLTSITSYRSSELIYDVDIDMSAIELVHTAAFPEETYQFSQEVNLSGSTERFEWVGGVFLFHEDGSTYFNLELHEALVGDDTLQTQGNDTITDSVAVFAQGTYDLSDRVSLTAGIRHTRDVKDVTNLAGLEIREDGFPDDPRTIASNSTRTTNDAAFEETTPKISLEFRPSDDFLVYGSVTKGFKSGGFNLIVADVPVVYSPETVWAYEAGIKSSLMDGRMTLNASGYVYDYEGYQVLQFVGTGTEYVSNAEAVDASGLEIEANINVSDNLRIGGNVSLLSAKYDDPDFSTTNNATGEQVNADGNDLIDAPDWSGALFADYVRDTSIGTFALRGEVVHKDEAFFHPSNNSVEMADAYTITNVSLTYTNPDARWEFAVVARNVFDEDYLTGAATFVVPGGLPGLPRIVTGSIRYRF